MLTLISTPMIKWSVNFRKLNFHYFLPKFSISCHTKLIKEQTKDRQNWKKTLFLISGWRSATVKDNVMNASSGQIALHNLYDKTKFCEHRAVDLSCFCPGSRVPFPLCLKF